MFQEKALMFLYCVSPVHMGAGTALGAIDNPIQRERHTGHPTMQGSGIKGALRHAWWMKLTDAERKDKQNLVNRIFGPESDASEHAGAVSFCDAQLVLFPVRSLKQSFVYTTCPTALMRLARLLAIAGRPQADWAPSSPPGSGANPGASAPGNDPFAPLAALQDTSCAVADDRVLSRGKLILESYQLDPVEGAKGSAQKVAAWMAAYALPSGNGCSRFADKAKQDLVVLSDHVFGHFVQHGTIVEPHVRIADESGTADDGGLFYTENMPPESLFVSLVMASRERKKKGDSNGKTAAEIIAEVTKLDPFVQLGGDATSGRGHVVLRFGWKGV